MVFIHVYQSKAWLVDDYRDPVLETNITTTVTGAATRDPLFEPVQKIILMDQVRTRNIPLSLKPVRAQLRRKKMTGMKCLERKKFEKNAFGIPKKMELNCHRVTFSIRRSRRAKYTADVFFL